MADRSSRTAPHAWILPLAALIGLGAAIFDYFYPDNGIHGTGGVLLVIVSTAVMLVLALLLVRWARAGFAHGLLLALLLIDIAGTALAAYLLEAWALLGAMALALIGWLVDLPAQRTPRVVPAVLA